MQPWWRGFGDNGMPTVGQETNGSISFETNESQGNAEGGNKEKETNSTAQSGTFANCSMLYFLSCFPYFVSTEKRNFSIRVL